ncbi:PREDICTED: glutathione S-transferase-like [Amphimedon queenslandica]|uniref:GST N-terminal domain-containing protein n=1 Tax=Amphimedon queenslandica TaxID=400682 RepID=A0A1X7UTQ8_AMPQE|nr:PREDICTED: glutathione S-transferase-like [Amphimedon queenslandica]|eukprot:XP_003386761.1 PREDICTED: glutathione S-transferase-like [Amphimedon queenslandica]
MSDFKLYYFPFKGRAEPIRILFAYKGIKYEDIRIPKDKWLEFKPQTPFGSMPVLEEGGKKLGGSLVVLRYLAEKPEFGAAGSNAWENAWLANIADFVNDFSNELIKVVFEKDEDKKKELDAKFIAETVPKYLGRLNEMATSTGYLCCNRLTYPDIFLYYMIIGIAQQRPQVLESYSGLLQLISNVESDPNIAKWLKERPQTDI